MPRASNIATQLGHLCRFNNPNKLLSAPFEATPEERQGNPGSHSDKLR
jgi:hypothetical protein